MKKANCECCLKEINVPDSYDPKKRAAVCDPKKTPLCAIVLSLFNQLWSDRAIAEREVLKLQKRLPKP